MKNRNSFLFAANCLLFFAITLTAAPVNDSAKAQTFETGCATLPSQIGRIQFRHSIDDACGRVVGGSPGSRLQNAAKNNFCASNTPIPITRGTLVQLQEKINESGLVFGGTNLPRTRDSLKNLTINDDGRQRTLSEGDAVMIVGFIKDARHSNTQVTRNRRTGTCRVSGGEGVNCNRLGCENNDIHIDLADTPGATACEGFTAEISPHLRPLIWDKITSPTYEADFRRFPVRITGQLFFDASHKPCRNGQGSEPRRSSSWEIHPVYGIDVCRFSDAARCRVDDESAWVAFHLELGQRPAATEDKCRPCVRQARRRLRAR